MSAEDGRFMRRVRDVRTALGMTQQELADKCSVHRTTVNAIEQGRHDTRLRTACDIAAALGFTLAEMLSAEPLKAEHVTTTTVEVQ